MTAPASVTAGNLPERIVPTSRAGAAQLLDSDLFAGMRLPLVAAPMFLVTGPDIVIEACKSGIMAGAASASARSPEEYDEWLERIERELAAFESKTGRQPGPYAANLSAGAGKDKQRAAIFERQLDICKRRRIPIVISVGGAPADLVKEVHGWGGVVFHDATSVRHAEKAAEAGVDGINLIAGGGGGHAGTVNPFALVPQVREFFDGVIVLGGAISTGSGMLAAQALGADLCYMGTRFIATQESMAPQAYKDMLVTTGTNEIIYTPAFTQGVPCNFMKTSIRANGFDPDDLSTSAMPDNPLHSERKPWRDIWAAGHGVGLIRDIPTVAALVDRIEREYDIAVSGLDERLGNRAGRRPTG
ncbi:nitronate monooxygenase [Sphingobium xenophagum]|uniref:Nitronate monooxygenase n=1 Tax=Sphingobium xenophagum TaxID=121428 RepID=A0ABU1X7K2_SPHXE|nr:nitronate monooxygenase [Sphingobium xenophagum]MDR7157269.1 nitronate monooxygenase [Sphingobium xenophagum]